MDEGEDEPAKGSMQRRASAVCKLQNPSTIMTAVDTETFEPRMLHMIIATTTWRKLFIAKITYNQ